jgi:uncharacterized phage protein gp47/JayE
MKEILDNILRDIRNLQSEADIGTDSDHYIRSAAVAAAIEGLYQKLAWVYRQIFPDTADEAELIHAAAMRGLWLKQPVAATGVVALIGNTGVELLPGATLKHITSGEIFTAKFGAVIGSDATATALVEAQTVGLALNNFQGALTLTSPPLGMDAAANFIGKTSGGEDEEKTASLLARLLNVMQFPPGGDADYVYRRWAKEVDGIADALVLPNRRGGGSIDLVVTASTGVPSAKAITDCQAHVESQCSVFADVWVYPPTLKVIECSALVELAQGYQLADVEESAQRAYDALLGNLKPREGLKRSHIEAMLNNLPGITDRILQTPTNNIGAEDDPSLIGWIRPGKIALGLIE